jgi:hypothetical protein
MVNNGSFRDSNVDMEFDEEEEEAIQGLFEFLKRVREEGKSVSSYKEESV